jgi:hypothetical protein
MKPTSSVRTSRVLSAASILTLAVGAVAQQEPPAGTPQGSLEERVRALEQQLRQERMGAQPQDASFRASWVSLDTAGIPDLQDTPKPPGVSSTVDLKLWGRVNFAASYDNFQGTGGVGGADIQNFITQEGNEELNFNNRDSRFGFAAANTWDDWTGRAVVEIDFYGSTSGSNLLPRLRLGYVELAKSNGFSLRVGQDWVPIASLNPNTIDFGILSWAGNLYNRVPQITARYNADGWEALIGAMHNRVAGAQDQQENMPWFIAKLACTSIFDKKGMVAIGGGLRKNNITPTGGVSEDASCWLAAAEAKLPICSDVTILSEVWWGTGVGAEFTRTGLDYDATGDTMDGAGGFVSLEWKATDKVSVTVGGGVDQPHDQDLTPTTAFGVAVPFDENHVWFANVRYQVSKQIGFGVEIMDMHTELREGVVSGDDGQTLRGQRVTIGSWFIF